MPRSRSPDRDKAFELWRDSGGEKKLKDIAVSLGISDSQVRKWKNQDGWDERLKGNVTESKSNVTKPKSGAPKGNKNAVGNVGGAAPVGNSNAVTHGFFRRIFPDDEDTLSIVGDIAAMDPLDMLWQNIVIQYTAIARAQRIMFVRDQMDETKVLKKVKGERMTNEAGEVVAEVISEEEWEYQHAWDKQAMFLQAQSRAIKTLEGLISRYEEMLPTSPHAEQHRLRIEKLKADIEKVRGKDNTDDSLTITVDYGEDDG